MNELLGLTARQAAALGRIAHAPVPAAPPLTAEFLTAAPWWYGLLSTPALISGAVILSAVSVPFIKGAFKEKPPVEEPASTETVPGTEGTGYRSPADSASREAAPPGAGADAPRRYLWHEVE
jgi:hypothetical protein